MVFVKQPMALSGSANYTLRLFYYDYKKPLGVSLLVNVSYQYSNFLKNMLVEYFPKSNWGKWDN